MKRKVIALALIMLCTIFSFGGTWVSELMLSRSYRIYEGVTIVLDAGHGGKDKGAQFDGVYESDINLAIVKKLKEELKEIGIDVILTREDDRDLAGEDAIVRKSEDMKKRMEVINQDKVDLYISIHMNAYVDSSVKGSQIFYKKGNEDAKVFAQSIQKSIFELTKSKLQIKTGDYYVLNKSDKIGVLLECGFLSNMEDRNNLKNEIYQKKLVKKIKEGIMHFLKVVYE